ncbi:MAG TPA: hypothetical protein VFX28_16625 [Methylomirabilota bacterium]|nr:hypothetical protein [Methylomirabilota bacterium]
MTGSRWSVLALLLAYAVAFGAVALGTALPVFDDHPGQLYRVWHVVQLGPAPWAWNTGWWTGSPELQFYPPGFAYASALLHAVSLGLVGVAGAYQVMVWVAWLAPGVTTYLLLARALGAGWPALPGALVALTLSAGVTAGVEGGVRVGMVAARLGWALLPLLGLVLLPWVEGRRRPPWAAVPLVAAVVLTHPAHAPAAVTLVALAAAVGGERARRLRHAAAGLGLAAGLTAFWTLPLLVRLDYTRALAWGRLELSDAVRVLAEHPLATALAILGLLALPALPPRTPAGIVLGAWPWLLAAVVALDWRVEPLGLAWLPADRVVDGFWLAAVVAAGHGVGRLLLRLGRGWALPAASLAAVALTAALGGPGTTLMLWPRAGDWPAYAPTARGLRLDALWRALEGAPRGRVLFVRSGVPLVFGDAWWRPHTHVTALTPLETRRGIVNGTFTHPSPVAALVYRGHAGREPVTRLVEQLDGRTLFGRPLESLDAARLDGHAEALGVSTIVALEDDRPRLAALADSALLTAGPPLSPFLIYTRKPVSLPEPVRRGRWRLRAEGAAGDWVPARVAYYPLWRAEAGGTPLATRRNDHGQLEVQLPAPRATIDLVYGPGLAELSGVAVTALTLLALPFLVVLSRRPHPDANSPPSRPAITNVFGI